jgi:hypothetical protein
MCHLLSRISENFCYLKNTNIAALVAQLVARMLNKPWVVERIRSWVRTPAGVSFWNDISACPYLVTFDDHVDRPLSVLRFARPSMERRVAVLRFELIPVAS